MVSQGPQAAVGALCLSDPVRRARSGRRGLPWWQLLSKATGAWAYRVALGLPTALSTLPPATGQSRKPVPKFLSLSPSLKVKFTLRSDDSPIFSPQLPSYFLPQAFPLIKPWHISSHLGIWCLLLKDADLTQSCDFVPTDITYLSSQLKQLRLVFRLRWARSQIAFSSRVSQP